MSNLSGQLLLNRYLVESKIDEGGMSYIYKAVDIQTNDVVAIKAIKDSSVFDTEKGLDFMNEVKASYVMCHPNIVQLLNVGNYNGTYFMCLEYVEGKTLKEYILQHGPIEPKLATKICIQILSALKHAHEKNIIHRDIKPQNIVIDKEFNAKILDFGIAQVASSESSKKDVALGSVQYVSPEQAQGKEAVYASDLYSSAIVLYEMLTGVLPFNGKTPREIAEKQVNASYKSIVDINPKLSKMFDIIISAAMQKDPKDRYQNANDMIEDLNAYLMGAVPKNAIEIIEKQKAPNKTISEIKINAIKKAKKSVIKHNKIIVILIPIFLISFIAISILGINMIYKYKNTIYAPNLIGVDRFTALNIINRSGLQVMNEFTYSDTVNQNIIISQKPSPYEKMNSGDTIVINISRGKKVDIVPNLVGLTLGDAYDLAIKNNFTINVVEMKLSKDIEQGIITEQMIDPGEKIPPQNIVGVKVSGGAVEVPNIIGESIENVGKILENRNLKLGYISYVETDEPKNTVVEQDPEPYKEVIYGTPVNIKIPHVAEVFTSELDISTLGHDPDTKIDIYIVVDNTEEKIETELISKSQMGNTKLSLISNHEGKYMAKIYFDNELEKVVEVTFE